jgi:hypothetical protein
VSAPEPDPQAQWWTTLAVLRISASAMELSVPIVSADRFQLLIPPSAERTAGNHHEPSSGMNIAHDLASADVQLLWRANEDQKRFD